jgi:hypothetical protein
LTIPTLRKVIQIATTSGNPHEDSRLWALCDDGTMWARNYSGNAWLPVIPIPQDEPFESLPERTYTKFIDPSR